jgi:hypothetical protein
VEQYFKEAIRFLAKHGLQLSSEKKLAYFHGRLEIDFILFALFFIKLIVFASTGEL